MRFSGSVAFQAQQPDVPARRQLITRGAPFAFPYLFSGRLPGAKCCHFCRWHRRRQATQKNQATLEKQYAGRAIRLRKSVPRPKARGHGVITATKKLKFKGPVETRSRAGQIGAKPVSMRAPPSPAKIISCSLYEVIMRKRSRARSSWLAI